jgi:hypothetical protein
VCGVVLLGESSLLDINEGWMVVEVQLPNDFYNLVAKYFAIFLVVRVCWCRLMVFVTCYAW